MNEFRERLKQISKRNRKKTHTPMEHWPVEKKIEAVSTWLILGSYKMTSAATGVPYDTIRKWKEQPFWAEMVAEIRATEGIQLDNKLSSLANKSLDAVLDRIENGDFIYDQKTGTIQRKPAALRDVHRVAVDTLAKRNEMRKSAEATRDVAQSSVAEQLKMLAQEMAKWNNKPKQHAIVLDEVEDAIPKDVQASFPTGEDGVQADSGQEMVSEESGDSDEETPNSGAESPDLPGQG
jgi:hypothetical protein